MAAIIQKGNLSAPLGSGLFSGVSFWLSLRVPSRSSYLQAIEVNGGKIVGTDKEADICVVDQARQALETSDCGEKLYSYKFIDKFIRDEKFGDLEEFRVRPKKTTPGGTAHRGKGRNFFSKADDDILLEALSAPGVRYGGNSVYKALAQKYPHHTMHSWRGRWVDHFSKIMPEGPEWRGKPYVKAPEEVEKDSFDAEMNFELSQSEDKAVSTPSQQKAGKPKSPSTPVVRTNIAATSAAPDPESPVVTQTKSAAASNSDPDGIQEMNKYLAYCEEKFNLQPEQVIFAVERTGGVKRLMEVVLEAMSKGRGLPVGVDGIWTEDEDAILMGSDSRMMKKLAEKKGGGEMGARMEFLNLWNMA